MQSPTPLKLLPPEPYQVEDIEYLTERALIEGNGANWSEMGAKKTTTGLWMIDAAVKRSKVENPSILIITSRTGKGTFFQFCPLIMKDYVIIDIDTKGFYILKDGEFRKVDKKKWPHCPAEFPFPVVAITHYNVFSKSNRGKFELDPITGEPLKNENGGLMMAEGTQADYIAKHEWDWVWLDEAHKTKDKDTKWTVTIKRIKRKNSHISTGTGFINRPHEIWSPLNFLDKERWPSFWTFYDTYCEVDDWNGYAKVVGVKPEKKDEFRAIVREYGPRRTLNEVMPHLKEPLFSQHEVDLNPVQRKMYNDLRSELYALDQSGVPLYAANVLALLQRLRAVCVATPEVVEDYFDEVLDRRVQKIRLVEPSSKLDDVMETLDAMEWDDDHRQPVVIFSNFVGPLKLLQQRFEMANENAAEMGFEPEYPYIWLKENDNDQERFNKWSNLFPSMEYRIFMCTLQLGGESINLTPARHVIFLDRSWSPKDNMQGIGRIRRPGQEGQPIVININARDTVDKYIQDVNNLKQGWFKAIFDD